MAYQHSRKAPRSATLDQVAEAAGVSRATASRALNGGKASGEAIEAVRAAAERLHFVPNHAAQALASSHSRTIAIVIDADLPFILSSPFLSTLTTSLSAYLWNEDYQPIVLFNRPQGEGTSLLRFIFSGTVDGVIATNFQSHPSLAISLAQSHVPAVFIGKPPVTAPYVDVDDERGAYQATRYLLETGHRHIACVGLPESWSLAIDRRAGWLRALTEAGVEPGPFVHGGTDPAGGRLAAHQLIARYPEVDGVFAQIDLLAAGVLAGLADKGRQVPDQVGVVGFDNLTVATSVFPNLTTVAQPVAGLGEEAAKLLIDFLHTGTWQQTPRILDTRLVVRASV